MEVSKSPKVVEDAGDEDNAEITSLIKTVPVLDKFFDLHCKVGEGTFSSVFLATMKSESKKRKFAVKHLVPTCHPGRIERELQCLKEIGGVDHVVGLELCLRHAGSVLFIMPFMRHDKFSEYVQDMDVQETKEYMRALLTAIRRVHRFYIIHRDIKPSNFLYDRGNRRYLLVDFGLAQPYFQEIVTSTSPKQQLTDSSKRKRSDENSQDKSKTVNAKPTEDKCYCFGKPRICSLCLTRPQQVAARAGTPGFRAPEVLLKHPSQTPAIDIWACGVMMLCILSGTQPFFRSPDDMTALAEITTIFGSNRMVQCGRRLGKKIMFSKNIPGIDIVTLCYKLQRRNMCARNRNSASTSFGKEYTEPKYPMEAYQLLIRLLDVDYKTRITAEQALNHPFFKT